MTPRILLRIAVLILAVFFSGAAALRADDWPQWQGPERDGVWREMGILAKFPEGGPKARWRTKIGAGYAGPAIAKGRVYVTDRVLDKDASNPKNPFKKDLVKGKERILCLDEKTGEIIWTHEYDCPYQVSYASGPRTTPVIQDGKLWTLGTMGDLVCLETEKGKVVWSKNLVKEYGAKVPLWGFSAHLLIDGDRLISLVGGKESAVVAFDKSSGKEVWKALSAPEIGYCPPMIFKAGDKRQLIIWLPEAVNSLDPALGKKNWSEPFPVHQNLTIPTPRLQGDQLFLTSFYNGSMMLKLKPDASGVTSVWKGKWWNTKSGGKEASDETDGLHSIMCTPFWKDGYIYGVCSYGELRCIKVETGARVWESLEATGSKKEKPDRWNNAFIVPQGDRYFLFNEKGDLIIANLTEKGYKEISRANIIKADNRMAGRPVVWSYPAFANKCVFVRNDKEIACIELAEK